MSNIFISYGDQKYRKSIKRIKKQADEVGIFDKIITYGPKDLPQYIKCSPLFSSCKGGGYWLWKPYIIIKSLEQCHENDVVYYVDAGCTLNPQSEEWLKFQEILKSYQAIVFQYRSNTKYDGWEQFCKIPQNNNPALKHWIKPTTKNYFTNYIGNEGYLDFNKIMGGIIIVKKTTSIPLFLSEWYNISLYYPELVCDPFGEDLNRLPGSFNVHRHDQTIITPLAYKYNKIDRIAIIPETSESSTDSAAIIASRTVVWSWNFYDKAKFQVNRLYNYFAVVLNKRFR